MRATIVFLTIVIAAATAQFVIPNPSWVELLEKCRRENGYKDDLPKEEKDEIEKCAFACTMKRLGNLDENGYWKGEQTANALPKDYPDYDKVTAALRLCSKLKGETDCQTPEILRECLMKELPCASQYECKTNADIFMLLTPEIKNA